MTDHLSRRHLITLAGGTAMIGAAGVLARSGEPAAATPKAAGLGGHDADPERGVHPRRGQR